MPPPCISDAYVPNFATETSVPDANLRYADTLITNRKVASTGWWTCDQIVFPPIALPGPTSRAVIWRNIDSLPLFLCQFPVLPANTVARPFALLISVSKPGVIRL